MAKQVAVWGIDIGQSALKALRCRPYENQTRIVADAFDYIEYPKILSQPDVNPDDAAELVHDALQQFLSRNSVRGDKVVLGVSGQNGLARFIKLPPVETSKIPDIVKYEAKQQIPFPLEEVVWDFQQLAGGSADEGFALEAEVGLFAMKRDQVYKMLKPLDRVDVEVDVIQLTPLALYNYICFDQMQNLPSPEEYDPENPPPSLVVLSLGTDTTDLVVTNGFRVWQRSIPLGGSHFTKALTKELKLKFATAEHLKRNASQAEDPKALFQAMRPVFNDLLTEVQRSLGYFKNMDRRAKIGRVVALGNVMKLPGLQRFLGQNLGYELAKVDGYRGLVGPGVIDQPAFKENLLAFGVCYGLALQGLNLGRINTTLLPPEIKQFRMIRAKKPWVVAAVAMLLLACGASYFQHWRQVQSATLDPPRSPQSAPSFYQARLQATTFVSDAGQWKMKFEESKTSFAKADDVGRSMLQNVVGRDRWLKLIRAINYSLPRSQGERSKDIAKRPEIKLDALECRWVEKLEDWYAIAATHSTAAPVAGTAAPVDQNQAAMNQGMNPGIVDPNVQAQGMPAAPAAPAGPTGPGWVFKIKAHHYHNEDPQNQGATFVRNTLLKNLEQDTVPVPADLRDKVKIAAVEVKKLGIEFPVMIGKPIPEDFPLKFEEEDDGADAPAAGAAPMGGEPKTKVQNQRRLNFTIEFCWRPPQAVENPANPMGAPPPNNQQVAR